MQPRAQPRRNLAPSPFPPTRFPPAQLRLSPPTHFIHRVSPFLSTSPLDSFPLTFDRSSSLRFPGHGKKRFEATRRIREMETDMNSKINRGEVPLNFLGNVLHWHVPILAMTTDVIQATHEKCLKLEMDGYVTKPFEGEQLYRELTRFFKTATKKNQ